MLFQVQLSPAALIPTHPICEGCSLMLICWPTLPTSNFLGSQDHWGWKSPLRSSSSTISPTSQPCSPLNSVLRCHFQGRWLHHCPWQSSSPFQPCENIFLVSNQNLPWHNWRPFPDIQSLVTCSLEPVTWHFLTYTGQYWTNAAVLEMVSSYRFVGWRGHRLRKMLTEEEAREVPGLAASSSGFILVGASSLCDRLWWQLVAWVHRQLQGWETESQAKGDMGHWKILPRPEHSFSFNNGIMEFVQ